ncbi:MAG: carbonic anhydrase [Minwuia sp.]|nr:carbonic anhydrase [Minwuia sp.]
MSLDQLLDGYQAFIEKGFASNADRYRQLEALGQSPSVMIIACADSRVDPATIFNAGPGELFIIRNVANVVPRYAPDGRAHGVSAALEFAIKVLKVSEIVVMGHAGCSGVKALLMDYEDTDGIGEFVVPWMASSHEILDRVMSHSAGHKVDTILGQMEEENIRLGLKNLMTFPWIADLVREGRVRLHGMHFGIAKGRLARLDPATDNFVTVERPEIPALKPAPTSHGSEAPAPGPALAAQKDGGAILP